MLFHWLPLSLIACAAGAVGGPARARRSFHVDQVPNPYHHRNGPAEYAYAHMKYGLDVPEGLKKHVGNIKSDAAADGGWGEIPAWAQQNDLEYLSPVFVGDPPQMVFLNFDTGSADTWMYSSETHEGHRNGQRFYTREDSKSSQKVENSSWFIRYGDGSYASGNVYRDVLALGDVQVPDMTIQTALSVSAMMTADLNMSGLAGLCANHHSTVRPRQPSLLELLEPILDEYLFTADLRYHDTGRYRFGRVVKDDYIGDLSWAPINASSPFWELSVNGIHIGGTNRWYFYEWRVIADTGTTLMLLPPDLAKMYWDEVPGSKLSSWYDSYIFPCNVTDQLPDWEFDISGFRSKIPGHYMNYMVLEEDPSMCYGGLQPFPAEIGFGILGDVLLKSIFAVFDVRGRIGLADKKLWA